MIRCIDVSSFHPALYFLREKNKGGFFAEFSCSATHHFSLCMFLSMILPLNSLLQVLVSPKNFEQYHHLHHYSATTAIYYLSDIPTPFFKHHRQCLHLYHYTSISISSHILHCCHHPTYLPLCIPPSTTVDIDIFSTPLQPY